MLLLDVLTRYPAVTLLLLIAAMAIRDGAGNMVSTIGALTAISIAAMLLGTPHPELVLPQFPRAIVRFLDVPSVVLVWWFGRSLFEDDFSLGILEWGVMLAFVFPIAYFRLFEFGLVSTLPSELLYLVTGMSVVLMLHLTYTTLRGRNDDVIESRRRLRFFFVVGLVIATTVSVISERLFYDSPIELNILRSVAVLPMVIFGSFWLLNYQIEALTFKRIKVVESEPAIDKRDHLLHETLLAHMEQKRAYRQHGLTIAILAEQLDTQEHRLRAMINKGMGFRNFSEFLNHYRIKAVKTAMQDPEHTRTPILTLALEEGFSSLAPFNRAFKNLTGDTPTQYRRQWIKNSYNNTD